MTENCWLEKVELNTLLFIPAQPERSQTQGHRCTWSRKKKGLLVVFADVPDPAFAKLVKDPNSKSKLTQDYRLEARCKGRRDYRMPSKWSFSRRSRRHFNVKNGR